MKRFAWLLVLPYVVVVDTFNPSYPFGYTIIHVEGTKNDGWFNCNDQDSCSDLAAALNEVHERRTNTLTQDEKDFLKKGHEEVCK